MYVQHNITTLCFFLCMYEKGRQEAPLTLASRMPLLCLAAGKGKGEKDSKITCQIGLQKVLMPSAEKLIPVEM